MDQEPVTGGCHYSFDCDGFEKQCGNCPQLVTSHSKDRSHVTWRKKFENLSGLPIVFVAPTTWLAQRIQKSSLFRNHRVELIPLAIDTTIFRPFDQSASRDLLHLPQNKKIVFFGARHIYEERKGMKYLFGSLELLARMLAERGNGFKPSDVHLLVVGNGSSELSLPFSHTAIPHLNDNISLALAYQASDVFVCPSVEDAGPMMIPESMLCGTPVVAFNTGGAPDLITTMKNGYLASYKNSEDLAQGVYSVLTRDSAANMRADARTVALKHSPTQVVQSYSRLFQSLRAS
jgi:glycosyltransferase involved in cell wall biosynthesis